MNRAAKWSRVRVGDLGHVFTGRTPSTKCPEYFGKGFFFITPRDMHQGKHIHVTERSLSIAGANLLQRIQLPPKSICVSCIGWQMGEVAMTSATSFTNQQINSIVPNSDVDSDFMYYAFLPRKQELLSLASGIGVRTPILNRSGFCDLSIILPPLPAQRKIAVILSAYDDLIENNLRRIKILEEMTQNLYREWFVKFRFPGYEHAHFVDSLLGTIPKGWEVVLLKDLGGKVVLGGTPSRKNPLYWENGTIPWLKSGKLNEPRVIDGTEYITDAGFRESATKKMPAKTVLIAITGAILISFLEIEACANQSVIGIFSLKKCGPEYLHIYLLENISLLESKMSGSAQQHVNKEIVENIPVLLPSEELISHFAQIASSQYEIVANLLIRNRNLRHTRDLLLPRLISGELDVSEMDIAVSEEVQNE